MVSPKALWGALWNLLYDSLLHQEMPAGIELIAFADDVAIVSSAAVSVLLKESLKEAFTLVNAWMATQVLEIAAETTETIVLTKKRVYNPNRCRLWWTYNEVKSLNQILIHHIKK